MNLNWLKRFRKDEDGAVTVDWVVLTAMTVGMGVAALNAISSGVGDLTSDVADYLSSVSVKSTF